LLCVRLFTMWIENGNRYNSTKKVHYIKKSLAVAWLWYLMTAMDQTYSSEYIRYALIFAGGFE